MPAQPPTVEVLQVAPGVNVRYAQPWAESAYKYANAKELALRPSSSENSGSRILITTERRLSLADADRRLLDVSQLRPGQPKFYAIGGWPAVELRFREPLPTVVDGGEDRNSVTRPIVDRAVVAVAADTTVLDFDIWLAPEAGAQVLDQAISIAKSASFQAQADPDETRRRIQKLAQLAASGAGQRLTAVKPPTRGGESAPIATQPGASNPTGLQTTPVGGGPLSGLTAFEPKPNPPGTNNGGFGELEIAASPDGLQIVVAANSGVTFSKDGGKSFQSGSSGAFKTNDPSVTRGFTGSFYLGGIAKTSSPFLCNDVVSKSTNGGATFVSVGFSAVCPPNPGDNVCFPDQPHIAADSFASPFGAAGNFDQVYSVFRSMTPGFTISARPAPSCLAVVSGSETSMIVCSTNSAATWTAPPFVIPGGGDHPRVAVGQDGKVYTVTLSGSSILLTRFSSCASGLVPEAGFPVTVANDASVACPVPGLDRCNGDGLTSQMVATDPLDAAHLFVTYARPFGGGELIVSRESHDGGLTYGAEVALSPPTTPRRFMPWSCSTAGTVFAGWYDRTAAIGGASNDLTNYLVGSPIIATSAPLNLSINPDPQCASGWPGSVEDQSDSGSCTPPSTKPSGVCQNPSNTGSGTACFFSGPSCAKSDESCTTGGGFPKYGDYNGIACSKDSVIAAWSSATSPGTPPLPPVPGITIFSTVIPLTSFAPPTYDEIVIDLITGADELRSYSEAVANIPGVGNLCLKPSDSNAPDGICPNGSGAPEWKNSDGVISRTFALPNPLPLPSTMTITLVQGTSFGGTGQNWNIEDISVVALDHTHTLPPVTLLSLSGTKPLNDNQSCVARLKEANDNAAAAIFSLGSPANTHTYVGGKSGGMTTKCTNNGG